MRIATKAQNVYQFNELPESVQSKVIDNLRDINTDYDWWEFVYSDATEIGTILGIDISNIYFSGFASQGDGAQFEGSYEYSKGSAKRIREYAPQDTELHAIADKLQALQRKNFYKLSARVKSSGRYSHEYDTNIRVYRETEYSLVGDVDADTDETLCDLLRDYMRWIYRHLESEYYWLSSDEMIIETIEANEYEFTSDGAIY